MRRVSNVDATQRAIVQQLRQCGVAVKHTHQVGDDFPDLVCAWRGCNVLLEVKGDKTPVTKGQKEFMDTWPGPVAVVRTFNEAMEFIIKATEGK